MTDADRLYRRFPPFIREYIYKSGWQELRKTQLDAAKVILDSEKNLLVTSKTASGKTEAVLFPILTDLVEKPPAPGVAVLYIAPLKSLLNDQFLRLTEICDEAGFPVFHWHGDVSASEKERLLRTPSGLLQITPESLESMLLRRSNEIPRLFGGLRYIVLDEIHTLLGSDRGGQILCQIARLSHLLSADPRRIGLSATIGDPDSAAEWLSSGSRREAAVLLPPKEKLHWRIGAEHFYTDRAVASESEVKASDAPPPMIDEGYLFLYDAAVSQKALVFSNSREETEYVTATLRQIAKKKNEPDIFYIHHGNLSAALREDAEAVMKSDEHPIAVTCATVTMELGIDIGRLTRVLQMGAPYTVASFLQRIGRSGRRGAPPEMLMVFREEEPLPNAPLPELIPWELLRGIAILELYIKEHFIEPPQKKKCPYSLAFHQTLSLLASLGEMTPKRLAERLFALPPLSALPREDTRHLLLSMLENDFLEMTEEGGLIVGLSGERLLNSFKFYAVFRDSEDFTVRSGSDEIGTITSPPPVGDRFALAGRVWEVTELELARRLVYVKPVEGKMEVSWPGDTGEVHTRILEKMREILSSSESYPYLLPKAAKRLAAARRVAENTGMTRRALIPIGGQSYVLFPWLGTRAFRCVRRLLKQNAKALSIADVESSGACYIKFKAEKAAIRALPEKLCALLSAPLSGESLVGESEMPLFDKYDEYIPAALLRRAYAVDRLDPEEARARLLSFLEKGELL